jgi:hypothetical protein
LKMTLEDAPRSYGFLSNYVRALEWHQHEEDIFIEQAGHHANAGGSHIPRGGHLDIASSFSEMYGRLDAEHKLEISRWWHEMVRGKANQFTDLKARLARIT